MCVSDAESLCGSEMLAAACCHQVYKDKSFRPNLSLRQTYRVVYSTAFCSLKTGSGSNPRKTLGSDWTHTRNPDTEENYSWLWIRLQDFLTQEKKIHLEIGCKVREVYNFSTFSVRNLAFLKLIYIISLIYQI